MRPPTRKGELGIGHHDPPQEGHEHDAQQAAHEHQGRRLEVGVERVELEPGAGDDEGRDREDGPCGHGFADRADRPGHVLLQDGAFHQLQDGHADDRRWIGGGDRHPGPKPQVGVGGAEDDGHDHAQDNGLDREFFEVRFLRNIRLITHPLLLCSRSALMYIKILFL
jgi:hypothetical protein